LFDGGIDIGAPHRVLPMGRDDVVEIVVEVSGLDGVPFVAVAPDAAAGAAVVDGERQAVADAVGQQEVPALRAYLGDARVVH